MSPSDADLIARVLALDDRHAFSELVRRHQSPVRSFLRRLSGDHALADDLAQNVFIRAYRGLPKWRGEAKFSSWLFRIAYNVHATEMAKRARRPIDSVDPSDLAERRDDAPAVGDLTLARHDLARALAELSAVQRAAMMLTYVHGMTNEEVAEVLACPVGTVKTHIHRAKSHLREILGDG